MLFICVCFAFLCFNVLVFVSASFMCLQCLLEEVVAGSLRCGREVVFWWLQKNQTGQKRWSGTRCQIQNGLVVVIEIQGDQESGRYWLLRSEMVQKWLSKAWVAEALAASRRAVSVHSICFVLLC